MERYSSVRKASIFGIIGNIFLLIIKGIVGFITHSQSLIADAFNSASDVFSSLMTFIGNKIASKPRDEDHDLGHGKAEYVYSLFISITMFLLSINVLKSSFLALINGNHLEYSIWLVIVCVVTILTKLILFLYTKKVSLEHKSLLIEANSKDHRNDTVITTFTLISVLLSLKGIYWFDSVVGILISLWIFITSIKIFKSSYDVLMDKSISKETKDKVYEIIKCHDEIKKVIHFNSTPVGYKYQISFTIYVDGNMSTFDSHKIADDLEKEIIKKIPEIYLTVIHVNPIKIEK